METLQQDVFYSLKHTTMYAVVLFSFARTNITVFCPPEVSAKRKSGCERKPIV